MATKTVMVPGGGIYVNPENGNTVMLPGVGFFVNQAAAASFVAYPSPRGLTAGMLKMTGGMQ